MLTGGQDWEKERFVDAGVEIERAKRQQLVATALCLTPSVKQLQVMKVVVVKRFADIARD